jgi:hypothetical protein
MYAVSPRKPIIGERTMLRCVSIGGRLIVGCLAASIATVALSGSALGQCEILKLHKPGGGNRDLFGASLAVDGDVAVISDTRAYQNGGGVYVFRLVESMWVFETELPCPDPSDESVFGYVAVSGNVVVVGDYGAEAPGFQQGAAYVFRFDPNTLQWNLEASLTASDGDWGDRLGYSVAIHGDVVVAGAPGDENEGPSQSGSAYVYRFINGTWHEEGKLTGDGLQEYDYIGLSVSVLDDVVLVGAPGRDIAAPDSGSTLVFRYDGQEWEFQAELTPFDAKGNEVSGYSVALAEDAALVGAPWEAIYVGAAYLFRFDGSEWVHDTKLMGSEPVGTPYFGHRLMINRSATIALIGAPIDSEAGPESGAAYLFHRDGSVWIEVAKLLPSEPAWGGHFGSVALSGDIGLIGAPGQSEWPGIVYMFAGMSGVDCNHNGEPDACDIFEGTSEDLNANGIPDECEAMGDLNGDGRIDTADLLLLLAAWGACPDPCPPACSGDLDADCRVGVMDLLGLLANWS